MKMRRSLWNLERLSSSQLSETLWQIGSSPIVLDPKKTMRSSSSVAIRSTLNSSLSRSKILLVTFPLLNICYSRNLHQGKKEIIQICEAILELPWSFIRVAKNLAVNWTCIWLKWNSGVLSCLNRFSQRSNVVPIDHPMMIMKWPTKVKNVSLKASRASQYSKQNYP